MLYSARVVFPAPNRVALERVQLDEQVWGEHEVWIRTHYSLISAGTEGAAFTNLAGDQRYPAYPGYSAVGEVIKEGSEFPEVRRGDLVFTYSGHQQYARARLLCVKVPEGLDPSYIPFVRMATVAMTALRVSSLELGDWAAVIGQGLVGNMCAQLLQLAGVETIGIDLAQRRLELARQCGIRHLVDASVGEEAVREAVLALTEGRGVEATVEAVGNPRTIHLAARITGRLGEIILLGSPRGTYETDLTQVLNYVHLWGNGCLTLKGAHEWRYPVRAVRHGREPAPKHSIERNTLIAFRLMASGRLAYHPLRTHLLSPEQAAEAYTGLRDRKDEYVGVVFDWTKL
jgi:threonine dehydrogenase-like Zn-dependent dehydrogenase